MEYDSERDTLCHINNVGKLINSICYDLEVRGRLHDYSKLGSPEKEILDEFIPKLKITEYASDEYKKITNEMKKMTEHHYKHNRHHPEHYSNGIDGMNLMDLCEMLADWKDAGRQNINGSILDSLVKNKERFKISDQLYNILVNTIKYFKWDRGNK